MSDNVCPNKEVEDSFLQMHDCIEKMIQLKDSVEFGTSTNVVEDMSRISVLAATVQRHVGMLFIKHFSDLESMQHS